MPRSENPPVADGVPDERGRVEHAKDRIDAGVERFDRSVIGEVWSRLSAVDFVNQGLLLAGTLIAFVVPSMMVLDAIRGKSIVTTVSQRLGLNEEAAGRVAALFKEPPDSTAITVGAIVAVVFGLLCATSVIERIYELVFELPNRGVGDLWRRIVWPIVTLAGMSVIRLLHAEVNVVPVLAVLADFVLIALFFWWSMHFLLGGRLGWRELLPAGVFSALCLVGLGVFSRFTLSNAVIANDNQYGHIGIVFMIMTWLVAVGVVFILGPVLGAAWTKVVAQRRAARQS